VCYKLKLRGAEFTAAELEEFLAAFPLDSADTVTRHDGGFEFSAGGHGHDQGTAESGLETQYDY